MDRRIKKNQKVYSKIRKILFSVIKEMSLQAAPLPAALVQFCMAVTQISGNQWNHRKRKVEQRDD